MARWFALCVAAALLNTAPAVLAEEGLPIPIQVTVLRAPDLFRSNGQWHSAYEIQLTNWSTDSWVLDTVTVRSEAGATLLEVGRNGLAEILRRIGNARTAKTRGAERLAPGETAVLYMWLDLAGNAAPTPTALLHTFKLRQASEKTARELQIAPVAVTKQIPRIAPPLQGTNWLAGEGPGNTSDHRRTVLVIDGAAHVAQRYAIDWVKVGSDFKTHHGDPKDNRNYLCYGAEALAVSDGIVVEAVDGIVENVPNSDPAVPITLATIAGNHINLDLGGGVYAMYAHLQPGSLRVKLGQRVSRGQVLGLVGNTGNSSEPHLHFQLMDRNSPLGSEGIPYSLAEYRSNVRTSGDFEHLKGQPLGTPEVHRDELPLDLQLVDLPSQAPREVDK